ncbi:MAG: sulfite exporter TauE/SafE family protein [Solirubrobacteraceae bacterium]|nr:sulfite exporter TauE/SafE family protein [Solirubrobacteraceae bacterium]
MTVALAALAVFVGAALQSATGFGYALVAAPILFALLGPQQAVTAGVLLGLLLNLLTLATERRRPAVLGRDATALVGWSLPGLVLGALALRELPERPLSVFVALAVLTGLGLRLRAGGVDRPRPAARTGEPATPRPRARSWQRPAAGLASGALATSTSLSGPPLVFYMLARGAAPAALRDTLAAVFVAQALIGLPVLLASGAFTVPDGVWALLGAGLAGQVLGRRAFAWLRGARYEHAVLAVLAASALVALGASVI